LTTTGDEVDNAIELPAVPLSEQDISTEFLRGTCRVFITYSHDSSEHRHRVLALAERLRKDGVDAHLDQYVAGTPAKGWPRWMEDRLEWAQFVLVICTETC
jgi:SEFIR domain